MIDEGGSPPVLLLVDLQQGIDAPEKGPRANPDAEQTVRHLLSVWRERGLPVVHVRHDSTDPDSPLQRGALGFAYKEGLTPQSAEPEFIKHVNGAFTGSEVEAWLADRDVETVVLCGLVTDHCVSTTAREASDRGFDVYVVADGTATFGRSVGEWEFDPETIHRTALAHLQGEFAEIVNADQILDAMKAER